MRLFAGLLASELSQMHDRGVRRRFLGARSQVPIDWQKMMDKSMEKTIDNRSVTFKLARFREVLGFADEITPRIPCACVVPIKVLGFRLRNLALYRSVYFLQSFAIPLDRPQSMACD
jgi:hypothetical protein